MGESAPCSRRRLAISMRKCCWGPRTEPGLQILMQPMKQAGLKWQCLMAQQPIRVPVLPSPALQWTAIALGSCSASSMKRLMMSTVGVVPSWKQRSWWAMPASLKSLALQVLVLSLTTVVTLNFLKMGMQSLGVLTRWPSWSTSFSPGELKATNLCGIIQFRSPFSTRSQYSYSFRLNPETENQPSFTAQSRPFMQCSIVHQQEHGPISASLKGTKAGSMFLKRARASSGVRLRQRTWKTQQRKAALLRLEGLREVQWQMTLVRYSSRERTRCSSVTYLQSLPRLRGPKSEQKGSQTRSESMLKQNEFLRFLGWWLSESQQSRSCQQGTADDLSALSPLQHQFNQQLISTFYMDVNSKCLPWGRNCNPILLKDDVGAAKPTTYDLPLPKHSYGKVSGADGPGVQFLKVYKRGPEEDVPIKLVTNDWQHQKSQAEAKAERDFVHLNKVQASTKAVTSKDTTEFRKHNVSVKASKAGKKNFNIVLPEEDFRFGVENRPSTPIKLVVGNCYGIMAESRQEEAYRIIDAQKRTEKRTFDQKQTKTHMLRSSKVQQKLSYINRPVMPEEFKLSRYNPTLPKVNSYRALPQ